MKNLVFILILSSLVTACNDNESTSTKRPSPTTNKDNSESVSKPEVDTLPMQELTPAKQTTPILELTPASDITCWVGYEHSNILNEEEYYIQNTDLEIKPSISYAGGKPWITIPNRVPAEKSACEFFQLKNNEALKVSIMLQGQNHFKIYRYYYNQTSFFQWNNSAVTDTPYAADHNSVVFLHGTSKFDGNGRIVGDNIIYQYLYTAPGFTRYIGLREPLHLDDYDAVEADFRQEFFQDAGTFDKYKAWSGNATSYIKDLYSNYGDAKAILVH